MCCSAPMPIHRMNSGTSVIFGSANSASIGPMMQPPDRARRARQQARPRCRLRPPMTMPARDGPRASRARSLRQRAVREPDHGLHEDRRRPAPQQFLQNPASARTPSTAPAPARSPPARRLTFQRAGACGRSSASDAPAVRRLRGEMVPDARIQLLVAGARGGRRRARSACGTSSISTIRAGTRGQQHDPVGERDRLADVVGDQQHRQARTRGTGRASCFCISTRVCASSAPNGSSSRSVSGR